MPLVPCEESGASVFKLILSCRFVDSKTFEFSADKDCRNTTKIFYTANIIALSVINCLFSGCGERLFNFDDGSLFFWKIFQFKKIRRFIGSRCHQQINEPVMSSTNFNFCSVFVTRS